MCVEGEGVEVGFEAVELDFASIYVGIRPPKLGTERGQEESIMTREVARALCARASTSYLNPLSMFSWGNPYEL